MNKLIFVFFLTFAILIIGCKKKADTSEICKALFDKLQGKKVNNKMFDSVNYIAHGCEQINDNVPGAKSTVFVWTGNSSCTGTVVAKNYVITAAHCIYNENTGETKSIKNVEIILGDKVSLVNKIKVSKVEKMYFPDNYNKSSFFYRTLAFDIALLKTKEDLVKLGGEIAKITKNTIPNEDVWSVGFGLTGMFDKASQGKKRWTMTYALKGVPNISNDFYIKNNNYYQFIKDPTIDLIIAPTFDGLFLIHRRREAFQGQVCRGDSGGPQFVIRNGEVALAAATTGASSFLLGKEFDDAFDNKADLCNNITSKVSNRIGPYVSWFNKLMKSESGQSLTVID